MNDKGLSAEALMEKYRTPDDEHPVLTRSNWAKDVIDGRYHLGYWSWVECNLKNYHLARARKYLIGQRVIVKNSEIGMIVAKGTRDGYLFVRSLATHSSRDVSLSDIAPLPGGQL